MRKRVKNYKKMCLLLIVSLLVSANPPIDAMAAANQKLYNYTTKSNMTVDDTKITYIYNGKKIALDGIPGILSSNGVALGPYVNIFRDTMGISTYYNTTAKTVTFKKGSTTLILTLGSKTAKLNGKSVTMNAAPYSVKYSASGKIAVIVPTRFVAETFGFTYVWNSSTNTVTMTKPLSLSYDNKLVSYTGATGFVKYDGKNINVTNMPTLIFSNTAMVQAYRVFYTGLGCGYRYTASKNEVMIKNGSITVKMQLGSSIVYINDKAVDCGVAPQLVKNTETGLEVIMVPAQFTSLALGYNYTWNDTTKTSEIKSSANVGVNSNIIISSGSTDSNQKYEPVSLFSWGIRADKLNDYTEAKEALDSEKALDNTSDASSAADTTSEDPSQMDPAEDIQPEVIDSQADNTENAAAQANGTELVDSQSMEVQNMEAQTIAPQSNEIQSYAADAEPTGAAMNEESFIQLIEMEPTAGASSCYKIGFTNGFSAVTSTQEGNKIILSFDRMVCLPLEYYLPSDLVDKVEVNHNQEDSQSDVIFTVKEGISNYKIIPSADSQKLYVTFYPNHLSNVEAGRDKEGCQYVTLTGLTKLNPTVTEDKDFIYVTLPQTMNSIGDMQYDAIHKDDATLLSYVSLMSQSAYGSTLTIKKPSAETKYELHEDGSKLTIFLGKVADIPVINNTPISIKLPSGVTSSMISDEDMYYDNKFEIRMNGDHRAFFEKNPILNTYFAVANIKVSYNSSKQTVITVTTNKIQGYKYAVKNGVLTLTVDSPSKIYDKIVVLDAGHGGGDPGAINGSAQEKVINFNVLNVYAKEYFANSGVKIYFTRVSDTKPSLADRAAFPAAVEADLFISVHCNSSTSSAARGTSVYYSSTNKGTSKSGLTSKILANKLVTNLSSSLGTKNLGIIDKGFVVVRDNTVPAVLIELAFLSNPEDKAKLTSSTYQKKAAQTIVDTVKSIFNSYPTKR